VPFTDTTKVHRSNPISATFRLYTGNVSCSKNKDSLQRRCVQQKARLRSATLQTGAHRRDASQLIEQPVAGRLRRQTQTKHPSPPHLFQGQICTNPTNVSLSYIYYFSQSKPKLNTAMKKMECDCSVCSKVSPNLTNVTGHRTLSGVLYT